MILARRKVFLLLGIFVLGAIIGGAIGYYIGEYRASRFLAIFFSDGANSSTILAIKEKVFILNKLHEGEMDRAIETLEKTLDHDLMNFSVGIHSSEHIEKEAKKALKVAKDYRLTFPRTTNHSVTDKAVSDALAYADN